MDLRTGNIKEIVSETVTSLTIRPLLEEDIRGYCALFQDIFAKPPWHEKWAPDAIHDEVKKNMRKNGFSGMVAEYESQPVGYLTGYRLRVFTIGPSLYYLDQLFVDDRYRCIGIGKSLLVEMVCRAAAHGDRGVVLLTKANSPAEQFYRKNGFRRFSAIIRFNSKVLLYKSLR